MFMMLIRRSQSHHLLERSDEVDVKKVKALFFFLLGLMHYIGPGIFGLVLYWIMGSMFPFPSIAWWMGLIGIIILISMTYFRFQAPITSLTIGAVVGFVLAIVARLPILPFWKW